MKKTDARAVKSYPIKRKSSICAKLIMCVLLSSVSYIGLYFTLCSIVEQKDQILTTASEAPFNENQFKDLPGYAGAKWLTGQDAVEAIKKMNLKGKKKLENSAPPDMDIAEAVQKMMSQMGEQGFEANNNDNNDEHRNKKEL